MSQQQESAPLNASYYSKNQDNVPFVINSDEGGYEVNPQITIVDAESDKKAFWLFVLGFPIFFLPLWIVCCILYARSKSEKAKKYGVMSGYFVIFNFAFWVLVIQFVIVPLAMMYSK
ncbi:predicted protein [Naegleria gruberi]|uniref:Predicted protein n=1 Tax=Naegleria gruberi TaxID=5762 RepID=D2UZV4_NAEGR|nr:uncharacterized protein NAEGRDRAFT_62075 [Naegleria gruberi]EFC49999.1 predicted protein [Naegleria gruberi]|eukprot:XP_002682743.1 predicted protein [Naegleria gruberi strain NEG-M]